MYFHGFTLQSFSCQSFGRLPLLSCLVLAQQSSTPAHRPCSCLPGPGQASSSQAKDCRSDQWSGAQDGTVCRCVCTDRASRLPVLRCCCPNTRRHSTLSLWTGRLSTVRGTQTNLRPK
jgi:hypothetical protein